MCNFYRIVAICGFQREDLSNLGDPGNAHIFGINKELIGFNADYQLDVALDGQDGWLEFNLVQKHDANDFMATDNNGNTVLRIHIDGPTLTEYFRDMPEISTKLELRWQWKATDLKGGCILGPSVEPWKTNNNYRAYLGRIDMKDGVFGAKGSRWGTPLPGSDNTFQANQWYSMKMVFDCQKKTFDVWASSDNSIDESDKIYVNVPFAGGPISKLMIKADNPYGEPPVRDIFIDNIAWEEK
jgi:hypothetical protein